MPALEKIDQVRRGKDEVAVDELHRDSDKLVEVDPILRRTGILGCLPSRERQALGFPGFCDDCVKVGHDLKPPVGVLPGMAELLRVDIGSEAGATVALAERSAPALYLDPVRRASALRRAEEVAALGSLSCLTEPRPRLRTRRDFFLAEDFFRQLLLAVARPWHFS
jgi:hypothetical protein